MPRIERVLETCLYAEDLGAAADFYQGVLGLTISSRVDGRHVFFRVGDAMLLIFQPQATATSTEVPPHGAHGPGHVAFAATPPEIEEWRRRLQELGIPVEAEVDWPRGGHSLYLRDPAGNSIEFATPDIWTPGNR